MSVVVAALYKFVDLPDYKDLCDRLRHVCQKSGIKGTLLLAQEGINGTVAGTRAGIDALLDFFQQDERFHNMEYKESTAEDMPFYRMKVRLKKEIVTLGVPGISPHKKVGRYIEPKDWNAVISDPDTIVIDTRNDYEYAIGTFQNADNPQTETFRAFPDYVKKNLDPKTHKKVAMFCTGGIRCEKASSYMLEQGFEEVMHLKGGILKYLEDIPQSESLWQGDCFVFDHRTAVTHGLEQGSHTTCYGCRYPVCESDKTSPYYQEGVSCPHCYATKDHKQKVSAAARHKQVMLAHERGQCHLGH